MQAAHFTLSSVRRLHQNVTIGRIINQLINRNVLFSFDTAARRFFHCYVAFLILNVCCLPS